jgi:hypothetical protein
VAGSTLLQRIESDDQRWLEKNSNSASSVDLLSTLRLFGLKYQPDETGSNKPKLKTELIKEFSPANKLLTT